MSLLILRSRLFAFLLLFPLICVAQRSDSSVAKTHLRLQFTSGISGNYEMSVYGTQPIETLGLSFVLQGGIDMCLRMAKHMTLDFGLRAGQITSNAEDVDSSTYSFTGVVTYKQCTYRRTNIAPRIGVSFPFTIKKIVVSPEVALTRQVSTNLSVYDHIAEERTSLYSQGKARGLAFVFSVNAGFILYKWIGIWVGYSFIKCTERIYIPRSCSACGDYDVYTAGMFHALSFGTTFNFK